MGAGTYHITIEQGSNFELVITWKDEDGELIDLTGYTARMQVRREFSDSSAMLSLTTENGRITLGGVLGTITISVPASVTSTLSWQGKALYDLELVSSGGQVTRLLKGKVTLELEVTR